MNLRRYIFVYVLISGLTVSSALSDEAYDFIIVGGGTSGCALARRLAEDGRFSVLIIEAGGLPKPGMDVPAYAPNFLGDSDVTFRYHTVPQANAGLRYNGTISIISGKMLSGTSSLNYMWFNRGNPNDYDNWAKLTNDSSWNYSSMLKYFKRVETYLGDFPSEQHGYQGPITVTRPNYAPGLEAWLEAGRSLGYPIADPNGPQRISFSPVEFSKRFGRRVSSFTGYIKPSFGPRNNLEIITNANATKILFKGKRAVGVKYEVISSSSVLQSRSVYVTKEVIISAGAYGSPLLLMKSGIGPRNVLEAAKIPVLCELPVGENLRDHIPFQLNFIINNRSAVFDTERDLTSENLVLFNRFGDGPFSSVRGATGQAFMASSFAKSEGHSDWPDLQLHMSHSTEDYLAAENMDFSIDVRSRPYASWEAPISAAVFLVRQRSRGGSIKLNPDDANREPLIDLKALTDPRDVEILLEGVKELLRVFETTKPYRRLGARLSVTNFPGCSKFPFRSDDYWRCYIKHATQNGCHPGGTCRMGSGPQDPKAVVDTKLRVIGMDGLRVVDNSIMPDVTNANTQAPAYGIAEKASEIILNEWKSEGKSWAYFN